MSDNAATLIRRYRNYRAAIAILKADFEAKQKPLKDAMTKMEGELGEILKATGGDSLATPEGTAYTVVKPSATIKDMVAFKDYVIGTSSFSLVDWKANPKAVEAHVKSTNNLPPGVNFNTFAKVNVCKGSAKDGADDE